MKTAEAKPPAKQAAKTDQPFFSKAGHGMLSADRVNENGSFISAKRNPFFSNKNPIQAKLTIGSPNDKYEKEADHVADKVVQRLAKNETGPARIQNGIQTKAVQSKPISPVAAVTPMVQAKCAGCEQDEKLQKKEEEKETEAMHGRLQKKPIFESNGRAEDPVQRKCAHCEKEEHLQKQEGSSSTQSSAPSVESSLRASKGSGSPLPEGTRSQMESSIGADFSGVRIHNNSAAAQLSDNLSAQAFTHGNDIYFNSGKYDTSSSEGKHLLAHELTHTVQQGASVHRKENPTHADVSIQKKPPATAAAKPTSSEVVNISQGTFNPSETVKNEIEAAKHHGLDVRVKAGAFAEEGTIKIVKKGESYESPEREHGYLTLTNVWLQKLPALVLRIDVKNNQVAGFVTIKAARSDAASWLSEIKKAEAEIGMGFHFKTPPGKENIVNKLEGGTLSLGFKDFAITIGGFLNMTAEFRNGKPADTCV